METAPDAGLIASTNSREEFTMPADVKTFPLPDDSTHLGREYTMASVTERDEMLRTFPDPMPATHRLRYGWRDMKLRVWVEPVAELPVKPALQPADVSPPAREARRVALDAMAEPDLLTLAAERGVDVTPKMRKTKALLVAAVIEAEQRAKK